MSMDPLHVVFWDQKKATNRVFRITQRRLCNLFWCKFGPGVELAAA